MKRENFFLIFEIFENSVHLFFRKYRISIGETRRLRRTKTLKILRVKHGEIQFHLNFMVLQRIPPNFLKKEIF